jgi:hypothetical protein
VTQNNRLWNPYYKDYEDHVERASHADDNLLSTLGLNYPDKLSQVMPLSRSTLDIGGQQKYLGSSPPKDKSQTGYLSISNKQNDFGRKSIYISHQEKSPRASSIGNYHLNLSGIEEEDDQGKIPPISRETWLPPVSKESRLWLHPDRENIEAPQIRMKSMKLPQKTRPDDIKPALKKTKVIPRKSNIAKSMRFMEN